MQAEAKIIIAFLFKRSGKSELTEAEIYLPLSMELGWCSVKEAQEFVKYSINQRLLVKEGGTVHPAFSFDSIAIPVGFIPSKEVFRLHLDAADTGKILDRIVASICSSTHQDQHKILQEIRKEELEKQLLPEVAAMYVARRYHVDISGFYTDVHDAVFKENTG